MKIFYADLHAGKRLRNLFLRLALAILGAHFVVVHDARASWLTLFTKGYYYISLAGSGVIAFLLLEYIYLITKKLNQRYSGSQLTPQRVKMQFFYGVVLASFFSFVMAMFLFWLNGKSIFSSGYFNKLFGSIVLFIFTVNVVYILYYNHKKLSKTRYHLNTQKIANLTKGVEDNLPAVIYHENKAIFSIDFDSKKVAWPYTISESIKRLGTTKYFQINRYCIIHRAAIAEIKPLHGKAVIKIVPKVICAIELITSRRKTVLFKAWILN
ncbi:MAG: LytTR family transcriptional regulator DNA-binding domain-containing protein [Bacteroidota bacterium]